MIKHREKKEKSPLRQLEMERRITICAFLAIPLILLMIFTYIPMLKMVQYSTWRWDGFRDPKFIGIDNYKKLLSDPRYFTAFKTSGYYFVGSIAQIAVALYFAVIFSYKMRAKNFFKGVLFFPSLLNGVAIGFVFLYLFKGDGSLNALLIALGIPQEKLPLWLGNPKLVNWSLTFSSVWRYMGNNMIMFVGAIESIPGELFEASDIDGASKWQQFKHIIMPNIRTIISLNMILAVKGAISVYEAPLIITGGIGGSMTFVLQTLNTAFTDKKIGLASAMGVVLLLIVLLITVIQKRFIEGKEE